MCDYKCRRAILDLISEFGSNLDLQGGITHLMEVQGRSDHRSFEGYLESLCRNAYNPFRFGELHCRLYSMRTPMLESLLLFLYLIKDDTKLRAYLKHHLRKTGSAKYPIDYNPMAMKRLPELTEKDIPELCDKLVKAVELAKGKKENEKLGNNKLLTSKVIDWLVTRPCMNYDFTNDYIKNNFELVPVGSQESIVLDDLLSCYLGFHGHYIRAEPLSSQFSARTFKINENVDSKLRGLCHKALTLASHCSIVIRFIQNNRHLECGRVNQALSAAMELMVEDYMHFIIELETEKNKGSLNIHGLWYHIQPVTHTMEKLAKIAANVSVSGARGGKTLSILHDVTASSVSDSNDFELCSFLTSQAALPFMESIQKWIFQGIIHDPYDEFMIVGNPRLHSNRDRYSDEYWVKRYQLRINFVPNFLEKVQERILDSGKYLNVVRECMNSGGSLPLAHEEMLKYSIPGNQYLDAIDNAYKFASKCLLNLLANEYRIMDRIKSLKRYLLLQQGDFVIQILDTCEEELLKPISDVIPSRLSTLLEMAIRIPSTDDDIYRDNIILCLKPQDLTSQIFKILSVMTYDEQEYKLQDHSNVITGFDAFTLGLECNWPVSLIFNYKVMLCYQLIFRHLIYCKYIEKLLSRVWLRDKSMSLRSPSHSQGYTKAFSLRGKMIFCIQNLEYYMMEEAIEPNWFEFIQALNTVENVDDILKLHWTFLEKCMKDCMLTQPVLIKHFRKLLAICKDFATFIIRMRKYHLEAEIASMSGSHNEFFESDSSEAEDSKGPTQTYDNNKSFSECVDHYNSEFEKYFLTLLKAVQELSVGNISDKFINILYRQNYNFYFSKKLEETDYLNAY